MVLVMDKIDATLFRTYITELEYKSASYAIANDKITLLEKQNLVWKDITDNYAKRLSLTQSALDNQITLQNKINEQIKEDLKNQKRKGLKTGAVVGAVTTLIVCLLVK